MDTTMAFEPFHAPRELHADEVLAECGPFVLTAWGMYATREATFEEWERAGQFARTMHTAARWCEVDWLGYGMFQWSEEYAQAFDGDAYSEGYVANLETLYRNFPLERRLQWRLPISVFQALCPLVTEAQDRLLPMIAAAWKGKNRMTRDDVRRLVAEQPAEARKRQRPTRPGPQVATLPAPAVPSGNGHGAPEAADLEATWQGVMIAHDRAASYTEQDAPPILTAVGPRLLGEAVVESEYGRQVVFRFDTAPDLREGQRVKVYVEVV